MARWQIALIIVNIISTTYLGAMQYIEADSLGSSRHLQGFAAFTFENRPILAVVFGILTGVLSTIIVLLQPYITRNQFRDSLMDGIFEQVLDNDRGKARITIFCDAGWIKSLWYKVLDFFGLWNRGWRLKSILAYCWEAKYIHIMKRWGTEHRRSKTHFCYNSETVDKCQGIVGRVRQLEETVIATLPRLDGIDLEASDENHSVIKEYMSKGYISDYRVFKSLNRKAPYIYGNFILAAGGRKKLVLAIDSWQSRPPFKKTKVALLTTYVKQIAASFGA